METNCEVNLSFPQTLKPEFKQVRHLKTLDICTHVQVNQTSAVPASDKETETSLVSLYEPIHIKLPFLL